MTYHGHLREKRTYDWFSWAELTGIFMELHFLFQVTGRHPMVIYTWALGRYFSKMNDVNLRSSWKTVFVANDKAKTKILENLCPPLWAW